MREYEQSNLKQTNENEKHIYRNRGTLKFHLFPLLGMERNETFCVFSKKKFLDLYVNCGS